jgi:hypothetical protein
MLPDGEAVVLVGMYELVDENRAAKIFAKQTSDR